jgi:sulfonate transport system substrate-binding protein
MLTRRVLLGATLAAPFIQTVRAADALTEIRLDYATYSPLSALIKEQRFLEDEFARDKIGIRWVQSLGSNKALEFLNAGSIDFGSTASAAALLASIGGNPIRSIYIYSRAEWTALVATHDSPLRDVAALKGKRIAVTRGTDPHIFLVRALGTAGLTSNDVKLVLLQHADGKTALIRGDVDAWAGLDPMMAASEVEDHTRLFYRNPAFNSWGALNVRAAIADAHPDIVRRVVAVYERARLQALKQPGDLAKALTALAKLPDGVIKLQLDRTDISQGYLKDAQRQGLLDSGQAMQAVGLIEPGVKLDQAVAALFDPQFGGATG